MIDGAPVRYERTLNHKQLVHIRLVEATVKFGNQEVYLLWLVFPELALPTLIFSRVGACAPCPPCAGAHAVVCPASSQDRTCSLVFGMPPSPYHEECVVHLWCLC